MVVQYTTRRPGPSRSAQAVTLRAEAGWWAVNGFAGQTQVVWVGNGGMTVNW